MSSGSLIAMAAVRLLAFLADCISSTGGDLLVERFLALLLTVSQEMESSTSTDMISRSAISPNSDSTSVFTVIFGKLNLSSNFCLRKVCCTNHDLKYIFGVLILYEEALVPVTPDPMNIPEMLLVLADVSNHKVYRFSAQQARYRHRGNAAGHDAWYTHTTVYYY
jgi:hypothetical protein